MSIRKSIRKNGTNLSWWVDTALPGIYKNWDLILQRQYWNIANPEYDNISDRDWDHLILLDACRFDTFQEVNWLEGELQSFRSPGSMTSEWLKKMFSENEHHDVVYVTGSPMYRSFNFDIPFHAVVDVWDKYWSEEYNTVTPDDMRKAVVAASEDYPNKRILSHWLQPHYPFIGEKAKSLPKHSGVEKSHPELPDERSAKTVWDMLKEGDVEKGIAYEAYSENLAIALQEVEGLLGEIEGRIVITSDHGNMFGERAKPIPLRVYGHPSGIYAEELIKVPWHIIEIGERRKTVAESPDDLTDNNTDIVSERLKDLGYLDQ